MLATKTVPIWNKKISKIQYTLKTADLARPRKTGSSEREAKEYGVF